MICISAIAKEQSSNQNWAYRNNDFVSSEEMRKKSIVQRTISCAIDYHGVSFWNVSIKSVGWREEGREGNLDQYATRVSDYFEIHLTSPTSMPTPTPALTRARIYLPVPRFSDGISCNGRNWYARACRGITYSRWETERFVHLPRMYVCAATRREERALSTCRARRFLDFAMPTNPPRYTRNTFLALGKRGASSEPSLLATRVSMAGVFSREEVSSIFTGDWRKWIIDEADSRRLIRKYTHVSLIEYVGMKMR